MESAHHITEVTLKGYCLGLHINTPNSHLHHFQHQVVFYGVTLYF